MKVLQILPELNAGGVERGTLELADFLVRSGHESIVVSNGGRLVDDLVRGGSRHIAMPVHRKHPCSLWQIAELRALLMHERPEILHLRSRLPAWLAWLAWKSLPATSRPRLVTTVHGFYSVNAYSRIMTCGEALITVSESVRDYVLRHYPETDSGKITVIHRGVDETLYAPGYRPPDSWIERWRNDFPMLSDRRLLCMPGRLTRWKGQEDFIRLLATLRNDGLPVHGLIVGEPHARKQTFGEELRGLASECGVGNDISFLGHRGDLREIMAVSDVVFSLSTQPEAFGRVSLEALALGRPVVAYDHGGVGEQLRAIYPAGRVPVGDLSCAVDLTKDILKGVPEPPGSVSGFTLRRMVGTTLEVYQTLLTTPRNAR